MAGNSNTQRAILRKTKPLCGEENTICPNSVFLDKDRTTTFGRTASAEANSVRLLSSKTPLMISRKHASVMFQNNVWTIEDHKSLNGVYVNGQQIPPSVPHLIKPGDRICFGVAIEGNVHEFDYTFERKLDVGGDIHDKDTKTRKVLQESISNTSNEAGPSGENVFGRSIRDDRATASKIKDAEKKIEGLRLLLVEKEKAYQKQLEDKEKDLADQLLQQKNDLEQEKEAQEACLMVLLEDRLKEKEIELTNQLEQQKAILLAEKEAVESSLLSELNSKLEEKDKELTAQLEAQRDRLENILQHKVNEQIKLQEELNKNKVERERLLSLEEKEKTLVESLDELKKQLNEKQELLVKQQDVTKKAEEMAKNALVEQMEDEFSCIICQELFIQATTLQCSHSFCHYCLKSWLKKKKTCPICRTSTNGTFVRSLVLDSAVEKIVATMGDEARARWQALCEERKNMEKVTVIEDSPPGNRGGNRANNPIIVTAGTGDDVQIVEPPQPRVQPNALRQPYFPDGSTGVQVMPGAALAQIEHDFRRQRRQGGNHGNQHRVRHGNGHCYICGMRGHWARTCPFR